MVIKPSINFLTRDSDSKLVVDSGAIITAMTGNASYPSPNPPLPTVATAREEFITAIEEAMHRDLEKLSVRRAKRSSLVSLLRQLASYVAGYCDGDMAVLQSSGFPTQKPTREPSGPLPKPDDPILRQGPTDGSLRARTTTVLGVYSYNWRVALASEPTEYVQTAQTTAARVTFTGLTPGQVYNVQVNRVGTAGETSWSAPGTRMVT